MHFRKNLMPREERPLEDECRTGSDNMHCFKGGDSRANEHPGATTELFSKKITFFFMVVPSVT